MLFADIGNTRAHIYNGSTVVHLSHEVAIRRYAKESLYYINVNHALQPQLERLSQWHNMAPYLKVKGAYETMGLDRRALCLSKEHGIFVSAGSAITVDRMVHGVYEGGFLLLGLRAYLDAYGGISPALKSTLNQEITLEVLPKSTQDGISFGIIGSIVTLIHAHQGSLPLYISGGDGAFLAGFLNQATFDETLIFQGMQRALQKGHEL